MLTDASKVGWCGSYFRSAVSRVIAVSFLPSSSGSSLCEFTYHRNHTGIWHSSSLHVLFHVFGLGFSLHLLRIWLLACGGPLVYEHLHTICVSCGRFAWDICVPCGRFAWDICVSFGRFAWEICTLNCTSKWPVCLAAVLCKAWERWNCSLECFCWWYKCPTWKSSPVYVLILHWLFFCLLFLIIISYNNLSCNFMEYMCILGFSDFIWMTWCKFIIFFSPIWHHSLKSNVPTPLPSFGKDQRPTQIHVAALYLPSEHLWLCVWLCVLKL